LADEIVGFTEILQDKPLAVTGSPPSEVIFPPETAFTFVISDTASVVRVATEVWGVVNVTWLP
jgi:hypothetical protein